MLNSIYTVSLPPVCGERKERGMKGRRERGDERKEKYVTTPCYSHNGERENGLPPGPPWWRERE